MEIATTRDVLTGRPIPLPGRTSFEWRVSAHDGRHELWVHAHDHCRMLGWLTASAANPSTRLFAQALWFRTGGMVKYGEHPRSVNGWTQ